MNKVVDITVEVWRGWSDDFGYYIPSDEITNYVIPTIDKERYFEINKEYLADKYDIEEDDLKLEDIDWEQEQLDLNDLDEYAVDLDEFDEQFAESKGYQMPTESDVIYKAFHYRDANLNLITLWQEHMETSTSYSITKDEVCLDEWDGRNWRTGGNFDHEDVHKIIDTDMHLIVAYSQWQGSQPRVVASELSLSEVLKYIENIDDGLERDLEEYKEKLLEL